MPIRRNSSSLSPFEGRPEERRKYWIGIWGQTDSTVGYECWPEWPELVERPRGQLEQEKAISSAQLHHRPKTKPLDRLRPRPRRQGRVKGLAAAAAVHKRPDVQPCGTEQWRDVHACPRCGTIKHMASKTLSLGFWEGGWGGEGCHEEGELWVFDGRGPSRARRNGVWGGA